MKMRIKIARLLENVETVHDPRRDYGNKRHSLVAILLIGLLTYICGGKDFTQMEELGKKKVAWLSGFLDFPNGTPDSDTFRRVFERVNPRELAQCLEASLYDAREDIKSVGIDGKTMRGSGNSEHSPYHVVSAWAHEHGITLGQVAVDEKSNEITAIPILLDMLDISGAVVTIDAMGCQKEIAAKIVGKGADYCLALKGNHRKLHKQVKAAFMAVDGGARDICLDEFAFDSNGHGRIEKRVVTVISASTFTESSDWSGLTSIARCRYISVTGGSETVTDRFFLTSLPANARRLGGIIRGHWSIENNLHWMLDVVFEEDSARARKDNSPLNLNILRKTALSLLLQVKGKRESLHRLMFRAAMETDFLELVAFRW
jgi:predicted transposase YbfD/YdcC